MASLLLLDDAAEGKHVQRSSMARLTKPVVPIIPRVFEKRQSPETKIPLSAVTDMKTGVDDEFLQDSTALSPKVSFATDCQNGAGDWASYVNGDTADDKGSLRNAQNLEAPSSTTSLQDYEHLTSPIAQLAIQQKETQTYVSLPFENSLFRTPGFSPHTSDQKIVFGGDGDSIQSSPTLPPSVTSTAYTHLTPASDTTSSHSQSMYQGHGHTNHVFETPAPKSTANHSQTVADTPYESSVEPCYRKAAPHIPLAQYNPPSMPIFQEPQIHHEIHIDGLSKHLLDQFGNPSYADCELELRTLGEHHTMFLHRMMIAQSPTLQSLLQSASDIDGTGRCRIHLSIENSFITIPTIIAALHTCYGEPPLRAFHTLLDKRHVQSDLRTNGVKSRLLNQTDVALAYLAAGHFLQLPAVAEVGLHVTLNLLSFATLTRTLSFALDGTLDPEREATDYVSPADYEKQAVAGVFNGIYRPYSKPLIDGVLSFIISHYPHSFVLDMSVPSLEALGGLTATKIEEQPLAPPNTRLSFIQFGDLPPKASPESVILSTILLSMPFPLLDTVLSRLAQPYISSQVIEERESRRLRFITTRPSNKQGTTRGYQIQKAGLQEQVLGNSANVQLVNPLPMVSTTG